MSDEVRLPADEIASMKARLNKLYSIVCEASRVSIAVQTALQLPYGIRGLIFHGALDEINECVASLNKAEPIDG